MTRAPAKVDTKPKPRKSPPRKPKAKAVQTPPADDHSIDLGPVIRPALAFVRFTRRRMYTLAALVALAHAGHAYNMEPIRLHDAKAYAVYTKCQDSETLDGYVRRWAKKDLQEADASTRAMFLEVSALAYGLDADCMAAVEDVPPRLSRLQMAIRDWQNAQRRVKDPQPAVTLPQQGKDTYQVAYEGVTP